MIDKEKLLNYIINEQKEFEKGGQSLQIQIQNNLRLGEYDEVTSAIPYLYVSTAINNASNMLIEKIKEGEFDKEDNL